MNPSLDQSQDAALSASVRIGFRIVCAFVAVNLALALFVVGCSAVTARHGETSITARAMLGGKQSIATATNGTFRITQGTDAKAVESAAKGAMEGLK